MINFTSPYIEYANKTLYWLPTDTKMLYRENVKNHKEKLIEYGWFDTEITYKFNSHGFRSDEFADSPTIMTIGCSNTCGIGLPFDHIWPSHVSANLKLHLANLAIGGRSNDTAFRLSYGWIDKIQPKIVVFLLTPPGRLEIVRNSEIDGISSNSHSQYEHFYRDWISDPSNDQLNSIKNTLAIEQLCISRGIKFLSFTSDEFFSCGNDLARDLAHRGSKTNLEFAQRVLQQV